MRFRFIFFISFLILYIYYIIFFIKNQKRFLGGGNASLASLYEPLGGEDGPRTHDLLNAIQTLSQTELQPQIRQKPPQKLTVLL